MIRRAIEKDTNRVLDLLRQVNLVHHLGRPDIFKKGTKYNSEELKEMFLNEKNPIFVYVNDEDYVLGYAFCIHEEYQNDQLLMDRRTLYIDDLCVEESNRGMGIGKALYQYVVQYAKEKGYYNVTLNVWECNPKAKGFYESLGLRPLKTYMEEIL